MIYQCQRHHRFGDRRGTDTDAGIMSAGGNDIGRISIYINGLSRNPDTRRRFQRNVGDDVLPRADAAEDAASIVAEKTLWTHQVAMFGTLLFNHAKDFDQLRGRSDISDEWFTNR